MNLLFSHFKFIIFMYLLLFQHLKSYYSTSVQHLLYGPKHPTTRLGLSAVETYKEHHCIIHVTENLIPMR
jgi:hypothetical protein